MDLHGGQQQLRLGFITPPETYTIYVLTLEGGGGFPVEIILSKTMGNWDSLVLKKIKRIHLKSKYYRRSPLSSPNSEDE